MTQVATEATPAANADKGAGKKVKPQLSVAEHRVLRALLEQPARYEEIALSALQIDYSYQDRPREKLVNQIADLFGFPVIASLGRELLPYKRRRRQNRLGPRIASFCGHVGALQRR